MFRYGEDDMTDTNLLLLKLIQDGLSNDKICEKLQISKKQLNWRIRSLKYDGYNLKRKFFHDGAQSYFIDYSFLDDDIYTIELDNNLFKAMLIADTHFGHEKDNMDYIKYIYEYCSNNNIHIILHSGDLLQGNIKPYRLKPEEQIEYILSNYPYDDNIINFVSPGNHDNTFAKDYGLNLKSIIENNRSDIVMLHPIEAAINVRNNYIFMSHERSFTNPYGLRIGGHSHFYKFVPNTTCPMIIVPTLSDVLYKEDTIPGAIDVEIKLSGEKFKQLVVTHLVFDEHQKIKCLGKIDNRFQKKFL